VFRVCSECVKGVSRVCQGCVQSVFRVCSGLLDMSRLVVKIVVIASSNASSMSVSCIFLTEFLDRTNSFVYSKIKDFLSNLP
jgi:hypothetical protein